MSTEKAVPSVFFAELDAILDTRMGTILRIDPNATERVIKAGYLTRDRDLFPGIDKAKFQELYKERNKKTLQASVVTPILSYAKDFCKQTYEGNIKTPFLKEPKVIINLYPYQLDEAEKELLMKAIKIKTGKFSKVEFVSMSNDEITPNYLKRHTSIIVLYDPFEWLEVHSI